MAVTPHRLRPTKTGATNIVKHIPAKFAMNPLTATDLLRAPGRPELRMLFVASTGGHLAQLNRLAASFRASNDSLWVTFDTEQSRSLLANRHVQTVPYVRSRDVGGVLRAGRNVWDLLRLQHFDVVVSTGAALALAALPLARAKRIPSIYIESVSRLDGPSLTGRILAATRTAQLNTQHEHWASERWRPFPSVLGQFTSLSQNSAHPWPPRMFVTLGTIRPYRFDALVDRLKELELTNEQTVWQLGETERHDLPGVVHRQMTATQFEESCKEADVVITHAGVGTILQLLEMGIHPVVVPRRKERREHVDDHQLQIAAHVEALGVATVREAGELSAEAIRDAARLVTIASE